MKPSILFITLLILIISLIYSGCHLFTPLFRLPSPANFYCLGTQENEGQLLPLVLQPKHIYGMGLTYATYFKETGSGFNPVKKKWWLIPIVVFLILLGVIIVLNESAVVAPFIYTLF